MHAVWIPFLFVLGACVGSFLNVVIYRLPRGESIVFPASHCPACGRTIKWYDNIPIVSWLLLRARCRSCGGPISSRYPLIELLTAVLVAGLYVCYFVLRLRDGVGGFHEDWPVFVAHAALLCGLLAASAVDIELFIVPLPVMWACAAVGVAVAASHPHDFIPKASGAAASVSAAVIVGLGLALVMLRRGWLQPSFLDAEDRPAPSDSNGGETASGGGGEGVAITSAHGVNPRIEILREVLFLAPAIVLGAAAYLVATKVPAVTGPLDRLLGETASGALPAHLSSWMGAIYGMLIGGAWIWGARIFGTLGFGKEAMGMGDVHILAAVGAVAGWKVVTLTFFVAPLFGLLWALYVLIAHGKRELPYGPWLALGTLFVLLFYDAIVVFLDRFISLITITAG